MFIACNYRTDLGTEYKHVHPKLTAVNLVTGEYYTSEYIVQNLIPTVVPNPYYTVQYRHKCKRTVRFRKLYIDRRDNIVLRLEYPLPFSEIPFWEIQNDRIIAAVATKGERIAEATVRAMYRDYNPYI